MGSPPGLWIAWDVWWSAETQLPPPARPPTASMSHHSEICMRVTGTGSNGDIKHGGATADRALWCSQTPHKSLGVRSAPTLFLAAGAGMTAVITWLWHSCDWVLWSYRFLQLPLILVMSKYISGHGTTGDSDMGNIFALCWFNFVAKSLYL